MTEDQIKANILVINSRHTMSELIELAKATDIVLRMMQPEVKKE